MSLQVTELPCEDRGRPAVVSMSFAAHDAANVRTLFTIQTHEWSISVPGILIGWNLAEFLRGVPELAEGGRGSVSLVSFDEEIQVGFKRLNTYQLTVVISGTLSQPLPFAQTDEGSVSGIREGRSPGDGDLFGVKAAFAGLLTTEDKVRVFAERIRGFLQECKLSTVDPWGASEGVQ